MVYFQVEDVQKKFDSLKVLEDNGWKEKLPTPAKKGSKVWTFISACVSRDVQLNMCI